MGWQQEQAAARAREQQRQNFQNQQSRQRADQIRADNDAANRRTRQAQEAGWAQLNARNEKQRQQNQAAADAAAKRSRDHYAKIGRTSWLPWPSPAAGSRNDRDVYPSGNVQTKKKGGSGAALVVMLVVGFIIFASSDSRKPSNTGQSALSTASQPTKQPEAEPQEQAPPRPQAVPSVDTAPSQSSTYVPTLTPEAIASTPSSQPEPAIEPPLASTVSPAPALRMLEVVARVSPQYPEMARLSGLRGTIAVTVEVSPDGAVVRANPEQGNPLLVNAARDAALQWRFNAYSAQPGDPLRSTTINFKFGNE